MRLWQTNPFEAVTFTFGEGSRVKDSSGKWYVDMMAGTWCNILGYNHHKWIHATQTQLSKLTHVGWYFITEEINHALLKLSEILPPELDSAVFLNTGSEAVELSLKLARAATGGDEIVVFERGYYGATTYAMTLSEAGRNSQFLPAFKNIHRLPLPNCHKCPMGCPGTCENKFPCLSILEKLAEKKENRLAAVLYEPVIAGGIFPPPIGFGARVKELASQCGALLISEEVTTGIGRTGKWFGFQHEAMTPDILVIGKAIGAGLPVAMVVTSEKIETESRNTMGRHVQSHQNDPFSGRIASAVISIIQEEKLVERASHSGHYLMDSLKRLQEEKKGFISTIRGRGLMIGVELTPEVAGKGPEITKHIMELGFIVDYHVPTSTYRLFPPYVITEKEQNDFVKALGQSFDDLKK